MDNPVSISIHTQYMRLIQKVRAEIFQTKSNETQGGEETGVHGHIQRALFAGSQACTQYPSILINFPQNCGMT